jgi:1,4-dihydroxy-2-naphthoate octaprenyltransferase
VTYLRQFTNFVLLSYLFTASCALGLCMATEQFITGKFPVFITPYHGLVFGATLAVYNFHQLYRLVLPHKTYTRDWERFTVYRVICFACGAGAVFATLPFLAPKLLLPLLLLGVVAVAYTVPLPFSNKKLRDIGVLKILTITCSYTVATAVLPVFLLGGYISSSVPEIASRFILIFINCFVFDVRDIAADSRNNIATLPVLLGRNKSYIASNFLVALYCFAAITQYFLCRQGGRLLADSITAAAMFVVIRSLKTKTGDTSYLFFMDGLLILFSVLALLPL